MDKSEIISRIERLQKIDGVSAVAPGTRLRESATAGDASGQEAPELSRPSVQQDLKTFQDAGWSIMQSSRAGGQGLDVVVDGDGHAKLLGRSLNVKFDPEMSQEERDAILEQHNLRLRRELGYAPGLVMVESAGDALETARQLNQKDSVSYAEPVLIEALEKR